MVKGMSRTGDARASAPQGSFVPVLVTVNELLREYSQEFGGPGSHPAALALAERHQGGEALLPEPIGGVSQPAGELENRDNLDHFAGVNATVFPLCPDFIVQ